MTQRPPIADELRTLFLFEKLTDDQLDWLCQRGRVESFPAGLVYTEGDRASCFFVLLGGTVVLSRRVGADDVEVCRTSRPGAHAGAWQAYLGDRVPQLYTNSMRVTEVSRFIVLDAAVFAELVNEWFPMAVHLIEGHVFYGTDVQELTAQRERLQALGSLSAGLTHELNNPAGAGSGRPPSCVNGWPARGAGWVRSRPGLTTEAPWRRSSSFRRRPSAGCRRPGSCRRLRHRTGRMPSPAGWSPAVLTTACSWRRPWSPPGWISPGSGRGCRRRFGTESSF